MSIVQPGIRRQQEVRYGATAQTLTCWPEVDGAKVDPSSATVTVFRNGADHTDSGQALVSATAATESADNHLSYSLDASSTSTWSLGENYQAVWLFTVSGVVHKRVVLFDVVRTPTNHYPPLRVDDLKNVHTSIDAALAQADQTSSAHQRYILPAWDQTLTMFEATGLRASLLASPDVLFPVVYHLALRNLFEGLRRAPGDLYAVTADTHEKRAREAMQAVVVRYNQADAASTEKLRGVNQPRWHIGPDLWGQR